MQTFSSLVSICLCASLILTATSMSDITAEEVQNAQKAWSDGIVALGSQCKSEPSWCNSLATDFVDRLYAYNTSRVLFKPTLAAETPTGERHEFRPTRDGAVSYMVGGSSEYSEDNGFALRPWADIRWDNAAGMLLQGQTAVAMGTYYFTDMMGSITKVEYTFAYIRDASGALKISLHHSSLPYKPPEDITGSFLPRRDVFLVSLVIAGTLCALSLTFSSGLVAKDAMGKDKKM